MTDRSSPGSPPPDPLDALVAGFLDELQAGGKVDPFRVLAEHPEAGAEVLERLDAFVGLLGEAGEGHPAVIGDYTLRRRIGRGGMGVVYEAWERSMDRRVALKVLPTAVASDSAAFVRFVREARTAGRLSHPNVVPVYGLGVKEQVPYYAMELVEGETLAQVLCRMRRRKANGDGGAACKGPTTAGALDQGFDRGPDLEYFARLARAFTGAAEGLEHAHAKGITHRDIKPSNLILDGEGRLRILDFGLARLEGQKGLTGSGDFLGTPLYMSPEQARRQKVPVDRRTDIYSLGATLYEMLTLRPPFEGKDYQDTLSRIVERDPDRPRAIAPRVPADLETIVLECLRKDPDDRYRTAEALAQDLRRFLRGEPIEARPLSRWQELSRRAWRHRVRLGIGLLAALLLTASATIFSMIRTAGIRAAQDRYRELVEEGMAGIELAQERMDWPAPPPGRGWIWTASGDPIEDGRREETLSAAAARLEEAVRLLPRRPEARYGLARVELEAGRREDALETLDLAIAADRDFVPAWVLREAIAGKGPDEVAMGSPPDSSWASAWLDARGHVEGKRWTEAAGALDRLLRMEDTAPFRHPGLALEIRLARGRVRFEAGKIEAAIEDFSASCALWPQLGGPVLLLGRAYCRRGALPLAIERFEEFFARSSRPAEFAGGVVHVLHEARAYGEALRWLERMPEGPDRAARKGDLEFHLVLEDGISKEAAGDFAGALLAYQEAASLKPKEEALGLHLTGTIKMSLKDLKGAIGDLTAALEIDPSLAPSRLNLAIARRDSGDLDGALSDIDDYLKVSSGAAAGFDERGLVLKARGDLGGALTAFSEAIRREPGTAWFWRHRSEVRRTQGDRDGAWDDIEECLRLDPRSVPALLGRASMLEERGETGRALADIDRALEIEPRSVKALVQRAEIREREDDLAGAEGDLTAALAATPEDEWLHCRRGRVRCRRGDYEGAEADCTWSLERNPDRDVAVLYRLQARLERGNLEGAAADAISLLRLSREVPADLRAARVLHAEVRIRRGEWKEAAAEADEAIRSDGAAEDVPSLYNAACILARASAAAEEAGGPDGTTVAERHAARAVGLVRQAIEGGFDDLEHVARDADLDALRGRTDFQDLVKGALGLR